MGKKYHCPNCGSRFVEFGAKKLDYKCPNAECGEERLILSSVGIHELGVTSEGLATISEVSPLREEWEGTHRIKSGINTATMNEKADHLITIARHYGGRIPVTMLCDPNKRKELSIRLFNRDHEFNYVRYVVSKAQDIGALVYEGDCLVLKYPEKLGQW